MIIETDESYHIGVCSSCLIKECTNPKQNKNHPEQGCRDWTRYKKYNFPTYADFFQKVIPSQENTQSKLTEQMEMF